MSNRPLLIIAGVLVVSLIVLSILSTVLQKAREKKTTVTPTPARQIVRPTAVPKTSELSPRAYTALVAVPAKSHVAVGETVAIDIEITTGGNRVTGVQLELSYDPRIVAVETVSAGDFFAKPIELANKNDHEKGKIIYAISSFNGKEGSGTVVKLQVRALKKTGGLGGKEGLEVLSILPTSLVSELDNVQSVLKERKGATLVIR